MKNLLAISFILILVGNAVLYMIRTRKQGAKCIGCPHAGECNRNCSEQ